MLTNERINLMKTEKIGEEDFIEELKKMFKSVEQGEQTYQKFTEAFYSKKKEKEKKSKKKK